MGKKTKIRDRILEYKNTGDTHEIKIAPACFISRFTLVTTERKSQTIFKIYGVKALAATLKMIESNEAQLVAHRGFYIMITFPD